MRSSTQGYARVIHDPRFTVANAQLSIYSYVREEVVLRRRFQGTLAFYRVSIMASRFVMLSPNAFPGDRTKGNYSCAILISDIEAVLFFVSHYITSVQFYPRRAIWCLIHCFRTKRAKAMDFFQDVIRQDVCPKGVAGTIGRFRVPREVRRVSRKFPIILFFFNRIEIVRIQRRSIGTTGRKEGIPTITKNYIYRYLGHVFVLTTYASLFRVSNVCIARVIEVASSDNDKNNCVYIKGRFVAEPRRDFRVIM